MILKCKKITNVEKSVCTAEQKIAYNYACRYANLGKKILNADAPEFVKADGYFQIEQMILQEIKSNVKLNKLNIDAVIVAFRQGFKEYCKNPFIAVSFSQIGNCFKIPYEII